MSGFITAYDIFITMKQNSFFFQHRPANLIERVRQMRRGSRISSKYEVAMQPEAESLAWSRQFLDDSDLRFYLFCDNWFPWKLWCLFVSYGRRFWIF